MSDSFLKLAKELAENAEKHPQDNGKICEKRDVSNFEWNLQAFFEAKDQTQPFLGVLSYENVLKSRSLKENLSSYHVDKQHCSHIQKAVSMSKNPVFKQLRRVLA